MPDKKFIERSMYHNTKDKNPKRPFVWMTALAIVFWYYGAFWYFAILRAEKTGKIINIDSMTGFFYTVLGSLNGVLIGYFILGASCVLLGYQSYKNKKGS